MKLIVVTTSNHLDHPGWAKLKSSLEFFGYEYTHILHPFSFGYQLPVVFNWANHYQGDATHMLYTDCFDTIAFSGPDEVIKKAKPYFNPEFDPKVTYKMLISAEKACFPLWQRAEEYPAAPHEWKYVNGGGWIAEIDYFKKMCIKQQIQKPINDQVFLMDAFLQNRDDIALDYQCRIFQTIGHSPDPKAVWAEIGGRFQNMITGWQPVFFHGNGRTQMDWVYQVADKRGIINEKIVQP